MTQRRSRRPARAVKRGNLWLPFSGIGLEVTTGSVTRTDTMLARYLAEHGAEVPVGTTLGPIRGNLHIHAQTAGEFPVIFAAIYLTPEEGIGANPDLENEQIDAMWYTTMSLNGAVAETAAGVFASVAMEVPIQTKAMRKIRSIGQNLSFQIDEIGSGGDVLFDFTGHIFMKLP